jgi:hypothetical protein
MSRQKGSRPRPAPQQRQYHEQFSRSRPVRATTAAVHSRRQRQTALGCDPVRHAIRGSLHRVVTAVYDEAEGNTDEARLALALSVVMVPVAFTILARVSRVAHPFRLVLLVSPLAVAGYLAAGFLIRDPTSSLVLSFGVAGAFVFRADPPQRIPLRITVVGVASVLVVLLAIVAFEAAVVLAPFVPFPALMVADRIAAARPARAVPG